MNKKIIKLLKGLFLVTPLLLAVWGLTRAGEAPLDALFTGVIMYSLNYDESPVNGLVELARWLAPMATAGGLIMLFEPLVRRISARLRSLRADSVVFYGDEDEYKTLKKQLRSVPVTRGEDRLLAGRRVVLFRDEAESLRFYLDHQEELAGREVYMRCSSLRSQEIRGGRLHLFSTEELGARLFWKQAGLYGQFCEQGPSLRIALVGFGSLGEQLLLWGLQNNIFSPDQNICYEVFGEPEGFLELHRELSRVGDRVCFHGDWKEDIPLLQSADRILVCRQEDQLLLVEELLFALSGKTLDILAARPEELSMLEAGERLRIFPWKETALLPENLFDDRTLTRAKAINLRYAHLYSGVDETAENAEKEWDGLNSFTRYSNISAADYHEIRLQMMRHWGCDSADGLSPEQLELLSELEHIRWCRFHWLNNWSYGAPVNGKSKNTAARTHADLVPYEALTEGDKEKDRENIRTLLSVTLG